MTLRQLKKRLVFWQELLNLGHWTITLRYGTKKDMRYEDGDECDGLNYYSAERECSDIMLRRGAGEEDLVHEMLHLVFDGHTSPANLKYSAIHERAINRTAAALMKLAYPEQV